MTAVEYLAAERAADRRGELVKGVRRLVPDTGYAHARAKSNLAGEIGNQLPRGRYVVLSTTMRVGRSGFFAYPDILVVDGEPDLLDAHQDVLLNPAVVVEVMSPSTAGYDRGAKFRQYEQISTLREYILIEQDEPVCERLVRQDDGSWNRVAVVGLDAELVFATVPARVRLADLYAGVTFPDTPPR